MIDNLTGIAYGLVVFAVFIGIGLIILQNFANGMGCPGTTYISYNTSTGRCIDLTCSVTPGYTVYNSTTDLCQNSTAVLSLTNTSALPSISTNQGSSLFALSGYLGNSSGGLVTWVPAVIALIIGVMFISMLMGKQKKY